MRFGADAAERHGSRAESLDDFAGRFHFVQRNCVALLELQQSAQVAGARGFAVNQVTEIFVCVLVTCSSGLLNTTNRVRIPRVLFAVATPVEQTRIRQFSEFTLSGFSG